MKRWLMVGVLIVLAGCGRETMRSTTAIAVVPLNKVELQYLLRDYLTNGRGQTGVDSCDYEYNPVHQAEGFEQRGREVIQTLAQENPAGLQLIQRTVGITGELATLNTAQTLALYQEIRNVGSMSFLNYSDGRYTFATRILNNDGKPIRVEGTITDYGEIEIIKQEPYNYGCPSCLAADTLIATPTGDVLVQTLRVGDVVWSQVSDGSRVAVPVLETSQRPTPPQHQVIALTLSDGRTVIASLSHPLSDGRLFVDLALDDAVDGAAITNIIQHTYTATATYDLLPASPTGTYWANGVLLGSTLKK